MPTAAVFKQPNIAYTLALPAPDGAKTYRIASPSFADGRALLDFQQRAYALNATLEAIDPDSEDGAKAAEELIEELQKDTIGQDELLRMALGDTLDEMIADGVPHQYVTLCAGTVSVWVRGDVDAARRYFESGGRLPKVRKPQDRKRAR